MASTPALLEVSAPRVALRVPDPDATFVPMKRLAIGRCFGALRRCRLRANNPAMG
jgi:hypothetical protein